MMDPYPVATFSTFDSQRRPPVAYLGEPPPESLYGQFIFCLPILKEAMDDLFGCESYVGWCFGGQAILH